jgi:hypothetical protein
MDALVIAFYIIPIAPAIVIASSLLEFQPELVLLVG